jgi:hypothetical protein
MPRFLLVVLATALLILPATAEGQSTSNLRGTVALKSQANDLVTLRTQRQRVALRVRSSLSRIRIGQRVELRGSTLRAQGSRSEVLARNVFVVSSEALSSPSSSSQADDDEVEIKGRLMALGSSVTVESATRSVTCVDPTGISAKGFVQAELVEMTCDRVAVGALVLRKLEHEDDNSPGQGIDDDDDDDDHSGLGGDDDDDDDSSGHGPGGDDDDD